MDFRLRLNVQVDAARLKCYILSVGVHSLGAKLSGAKIGRAGHSFTLHEILEERKDIELRKGGYILRSNKAENLRLGWGIVAFEKGTGKEQRRQLDE